MPVTRFIVLLLAQGLLSPIWAGEPAESRLFPALIPLTKPTDRPLSAAMQRLYDVWNPLEDRGNELYSNFNDPYLLVYRGKTYFWRVDATRDGKTVKGDTCKFTSHADN